MRKAPCALGAVLPGCLPCEGSDAPAVVQTAALHSMMKEQRTPVSELVPFILTASCTVEACAVGGVRAAAEQRSWRECR